MLIGNITDLRTYHDARLNPEPTDATDEFAEAGLLRGSDYIRTRYVIRYGLDFDDERVIEAAYIAALYEINNPGFWSTTFTASQVKVLTKVDAIQWTPIGVEGGGSMLSGDGQLPTDPAIDALLTVNTDRWDLPAVKVL